MTDLINPNPYYFSDRLIVSHLLDAKKNDQRAMIKCLVENKGRLICVSEKSLMGKVLIKVWDKSCKRGVKKAWKTE